MIATIIRSIPIPHFEFLSESSLLVNALFAGFLGGSTGVLLFVIVTELIRYFDE